MHTLLHNACSWGELLNRQGIINLIFIGPCIIVIVENKRPTWRHLLFLFHFLCAQHVSDINISIIRRLRLFCWITTLVVCSWFDVCWCTGVVGLGWYPSCRLKLWHQVGFFLQGIIKFTLCNLCSRKNRYTAKDYLIAAVQLKYIIE